MDDQRVWEAVGQTNSVTEIETGLHFLRDGEWLETQARIDLLPDAAAATNGPHKVFFAANLNSIGAVDLTTADGLRLRSRVFGLSYFDSESGRAVSLAETRDALGLLLGENQIWYTNAFDGAGIEADVEYLYTKAGLEQNIVLWSQLPSPTEFGLNPASTRLQVLTEFFDPPGPVKETRLLNGNVADETLTFGSMTMGRGRAYVAGASGEPTNAIPVTKQWGEASGRTFLVEEVPFEAVKKQIERLQRRPEGASLGPRPEGKGANVFLALAAVMPPRMSPASTPTMRLARLSAYERAGFVLDYTLQSSYTNLTLQGDTTYFLAGAVNVSQTLTIEGSAVVKSTNTASAKITVNGAVQCQTAAYRPAVFTAKDDDTVGDAIPGSTHDPTNYYGSGLYLTSSSNSLSNLRFAYASSALYCELGCSGSLNLTNVQFVKCRYPLDAEGTGFFCFEYASTVRLNNVLSYACDTFFSGENIYLESQHVTVHGCNTLGSVQANDTSSADWINSLLVGVTNWGNMPYATNSTAYFSTDPGDIFQTNGAGSHYLADGSVHRDAGTTNINAGLAKILRETTTEPPYEITTNITGATVLSPRAARDTGTPDRGYHYDPLDYVVKGRTVSANVTLTNGVALGTYGNSASYGLALNSGNFVSEGSPTNLNWIVRYNTVQEQSTTNWLASTVGDGIQLSSPSASVRARFTGWSLLAGVGNHFNDQSGTTSLSAFTDSRFGGGEFTVYQGSVALTNCLWERVYLSLDDHVEDRAWYLYNNLLFGGTLYYRARADAPVLKAYDNLFDGTTLTKGSSGTEFTHGYNGYVTNQNRLTPTNAHDVVLTNNPAYHTGALGRFYYPTNDGMLSLLTDAGNRPADDAGFYHYTTHTNQVKETNSFLDIGFHSVALNTSGIPSDADADGIPDYLDSDSTPLTDIVWSNTIWNWKADSLAWNCLTNALACTNGAQGNFADMFTDFGRPNERNTNFWFRRFTGWPAYSIWNNCANSLWPTNATQTCESGAMTYHKAGVLVSPEHVLTAGHMFFQSNTWLAFLDMSNNVVFRQVKDYFYHNGYDGGEPPNNLTTNMPSGTINDPKIGDDYYIGLLNEPVTNNIGYVKVIPTNWWMHFGATFLNSTTNYPYHFPLFIFDNHNRQPGMQDLTTMGCVDVHRINDSAYLTLTNYISSIGGGDSGPPVFFTLDGELCLAGIYSSKLHFGDGQDLYDPSYGQAHVNAAMAELSQRNGRSNIYTLTVKDLSAFPVYHQTYQCSP